MARRIKSLAHNVEDASPYESWHRRVSPYHREHRSKKGRRGAIPQYANIVRYKEKLEELKLKDLDEEEKSATSS
jgi:hypothetical protein